MRRTATAAVVLTTGLLLSACSSDSDTATEPSTESSAGSAEAPSSSAAPEPETETESGTEEASGDDVAPDSLPGLALVAADFPASYEYIELTPEQLASGAGITGGLLEGAEFSPAECGAASQSIPQTDPAQTGIAVANDPATQTAVVSSLTPYVAPDPEVDLDELAETCASYSFTLTGPDGSELSGDATLELLPAPEVDADEVRGLTTSVTVSLDGQEQTVDSTIYTATLRGVSVGAFASGPTGGGFDNAVLEDLLVAGLDKVRAAP